MKWQVRLWAVCMAVLATLFTSLLVHTLPVSIAAGLVAGVVGLVTFFLAQFHLSRSIDGDLEDDDVAVAYVGAAVNVVTEKHERDFFAEDEVTDEMIELLVQSLRKMLNRPQNALTLRPFILKVRDVSRDEMLKMRERQRSHVREASDVADKLASGELEVVEEVEQPGGQNGGG